MMGREEMMKIGAIATYLADAIAMYGYTTHVIIAPDDDDIKVCVYDADNRETYVGYIGYDDSYADTEYGCYTLISWEPSIHGVENYERGADVVMRIMDLIDTDMLAEYKQWSEGRDLQ